MKIKSIIRPIILLVSFLIISTVYVLNSKIQVFPIYTLYMVFPVGAALIGVYTSRLYRFNNANGRAMILITGGLFCWGVSETMAYISDNFITSASLDPSLFDVISLLGYLAVCAGIYQGYVAAEIKLNQVNKTLLAIVSPVSIILTIVVGYFCVYQVYDPSADFATNMVSVGFGVGDLTLLIASMLMILVAREYKGGKLASFWKTMTAGFFIFLIADIMYYDVFGQQILADIKPYTYNDLLWVAAYSVLALAMLENYFHISAVQKNIKLKLQQINNPISS